MEKSLPCTRRASERSCVIWSLPIWYEIPCPGCAREHGRLVERGSPVHGHGAGKVVGALLQREFAQRQLHVHLHPQRPKAHEAVNGFSRVRIVVEQTGLQHHLFGIEAQSFVGAGVVVVATDRVWAVPTETELEVVSWHALMNQDRPRIVRRRKGRRSQGSVQAHECNWSHLCRGAMVLSGRR